MALWALATLESTELSTCSRPLFLLKSKVKGEPVFGKIFEIYGLFSFNSQIELVSQVQSLPVWVISLFFTQKMKNFIDFSQIFAIVLKLQPFFFPIPSSNFEVDASQGSYKKHLPF